VLRKKWNFDNDIVSAVVTLYTDWIVNNKRNNNTCYTDRKLTDSSGDPLAYYPVELHSTSTVISGTTDGNGQVAFTDVTREDH
jgi:hypothetical protein